MSCGSCAAPRGAYGDAGVASHRRTGEGGLTQGAVTAAGPHARVLHDQTSGRNLLPSGETRTRKAIGVPWPPDGPSPPTKKGEARRPRPKPLEAQVTATQGSTADAPPHATDG